jgi:4-diphosphocytidyl-2-C-methyl-D-erythritol kinase
MEVKRYPAPGKLNLFLHVLGRRTEGAHAGYHELQSVLRLVERADRVGIAVREDGRISSDARFENDLCARAARALQKASGSRKGCDIVLEKNLPVGGGMGGGSSDAATVLLALNRLWGIGLKRSVLMEIGVSLGADVPFFLLGKNAVAQGIGERLEALDLPPAWYLVLTPQVSVSTKEIFGDASLTRDTKRLKIPPFFSGQGRNDLEPVVTARFPEVAASLEWLRERAPQARMTGSGACVFAEFASEAQARAVHARLPAKMGGFVAQGLERHPLHEWIE